MQKKHSLSAQLGQLQLPFKAFIGAGAVKDIHSVISASEIEDLSLILIGSYTEDRKVGNIAPNYWYKDGTSINSIGLANGGMDYLKSYLWEMVRTAEDNDKILGLSMSGETPEENFKLASFAIDVGVRYFEFNTACGNVLEEGRNRSKSIACYNLDLVQRMCHKLSSLPFDSNHYKTIKVGSYLNFSDIDNTAKMLTTYNFLNGVVTSNTIKSKVWDEDGKPVIVPDNGFGGIGGKPLKIISLGQVSKWREVLPDSMDVIGAGGIFTGQDILDYERAGAQAMQFTTSYLQDGKPKREIVSEMADEYVQLTGCTY